MIRKRFFVILLVIFVLPIFAQQIVPLDARLRGGKIHFQSGRYEKALQLFEAALKDFLGNPEARFWKALVLEKTGKFIEAAANFDTVYIDAPEWLAKTQKDEIYQYSVWNAFIKAGQKTEQNENYGDAIKYYKRATVVDPKNPQSYLYLSQVYTTLDSLVEIKKVADALFTLYPQNQQVNILLGLYFFKKEDWDSSLIYYNKATAAFMQDREAIQKNIGNELKLDSLKIPAITTKLIEKRNTRNLETYINDSLNAKSKLIAIAKLTEQLFLSEAELNICNFRSGVAALQKANAFTVDSLQQKYLNLATIYFNEAIKFNSLDYDAKYNLGMTLYRAGSDAKAESIFIELVNTSLMPLNTLSDSLAQKLVSFITMDILNLSVFEITTPVLNDIEKELAIKQTYKTGYWYLYYIDLKKAKVLPTQADYGKIQLSGLRSDIVENLWLLLGATQTNLKKFDDAIKSFNTVLEINYKNEDAYRNLAVCYREKGDQKKAYEILQEWEKIKKQ